MTHERMDAVSKEWRRERTGTWWLAASLAAVAALWHIRAVGFGFVNMDDAMLIAGNPLLRGITGGNIRALLTPGSTPGEALYIPVTYLIYMAEIAIFGLKPGLMHLTSVLLHGLNAALCFYLLSLWTQRRWVSVVGALIFALHPLQAESVVWLMARKDVLAATFSLATLLAWERWHDDERPLYHGLALLFYPLALLAKPSVVVLPAVMLLVERWQRRLDRDTLLRTLPFWGFALAAYVINASVAGAGAGGNGRPDFILALFSLPRWLGEWLLRVLLIAPAEGYYHKSYLWEPHPWTALAWLLPLGLAGWMAWDSWNHRSRDRLVGLCIAALFLLPAATIVFSDREFAFGDRYGYLAMIGIGMTVAFQLARMARGRHVVIAILLLFCLVRGWPAIGMWRESFTLWQRIVQRQPENPFALFALGSAHDDAGRPRIANEYYRAAIAVDPDYAPAHNSLGVNLLESQPRLAERHYRMAVASRPDDAQLHHHLAIALFRLGRLPEALAASEAAIGLQPDLTDALYNRGMILLEMSRLAEAEADFRAVVAAQPGRAAAHLYLGDIAARRLEFAAAREAYRRALELDPALVPAWLGLASVQQQQGEREAAIQTLQEATRAAPRSAAIPTMAARLLLDMDRVDLARDAYRQAQALGHPPVPELEERLPPEDAEER